MATTEQERRIVAGWKGTTDRCKNCESFKPCVFSQPPMVAGAKGLRHESARCVLNDFKTYPDSWCEDHKRKYARSESGSK